MPLSPYIRRLRDKIGHDLLHLLGVSVVVRNNEGEVLLVKSADHGNWMPVGGMVEVGEEPADAATREVQEETGIEASVEQLVGVFDGPQVTYPNGDQAHYVTLVFRCRAIGGQLHVGDEENTDVRFFAPNQLPPMRSDHQRNVMLALSPQTTAMFLSHGQKRP